MATITIDGTQYTVSDGLTVVQAAAEVGITIPHYCYHPALHAPANCRMCLIELQPPGAPGPLRQLATACTTRVADGMVVTNNSPRVRAARATTLEFLLAHHPLDCPTCDQAGECYLQDYSFQFGHGASRYVETKNVPPAKDVGPHVRLISTRCIVCTRCIRFCEEVSGTAELALMERGVHDEVDIYDGRPLDNKLSGNVVDICPVGALVSKDFLFRSRPWFLKKVNSICPGCSKGCNTTVEFREGEVVRIKPRYHADVNDFWMCDDGRYGYHYVNRPDRLLSPMMRGGDALVPATWSAAIDRIVERGRELGTENIAVVGSAHATNEELYLMRRLAREVLRTPLVGLVSVPVRGDDEVYPRFVIEKDKNPNRTGARLLLAQDGELAEDDATWELLRRAKGGLVFAGLPSVSLDESARQALQGLDFLAVVDILPSDLTSFADIVLPGTAFTEKEGCFTNSQRRVQRLSRALPPPGSAADEWRLVAHLAGAFGREFPYTRLSDVTDDLAAHVTAFDGADSQAIGSRGFVLGVGRSTEETVGNYAYAERFWG
jgi:NADH-quinone oxidoreductase subunit G